MNWNLVMGITSTVTLSVSILILIATGLFKYKSFPILMFYYLIVVFDNMFSQGYIPVSKTFAGYYGIAINLLDSLLMLGFLTYFSTTPAMKLRIKLLIVALFLYEVVIVIVYGYTVNAITITIGSGFIPVIILCVIFFIHQFKISVVHHKAFGKAAMIASLLFLYGCYSIIYFIYYILKNHDTQNTFLILFLVTTLSAIIMNIGFILERKRVKKLSELKIVRRELTEVYSHK